MTTHEIPTDLLTAVAMTASNEQTRYYICGVYVDAAGYIVATDGHQMTVASIACGSAIDATLSCIIPNDAIANALKIHKKDATLTLARNGDDWTLGCIPFTPVNGQYPPWRNVMPEEPSNEPGHYDAAKVATLAKQAKALGFKSNAPLICQSGLAPAPVSFVHRDDIIGVIMPIRASNDAPYNRSSWTRTVD